ncbi:hypothetical protein GCM10023091_15660 [Ravibacter arvi]|uniref:Beta-lactamase-related domain-containing protein n=1 Tax=Ravibacter arvi TaxID=2051041 RepID=A0ABP8LW58_9BACT
MKTDRRTFLTQATLGALQLGMLTRLYGRETVVLKKGAMPRSSPERQGFASRSILDFVEAVDTHNLHSLMILKNGHVITEGWWAPYAPEYKHTLYSLSKSFTSTAIGLAVGEGELHTDDKVISFFPGKLPAEISPNLADMRIRHLLSMSTGHAKDTTGQFREPGNNDWVKAFLAQPVTHQPGTHFVYNSGATYMLSAILEKVTGQTLTAYLKPRLFDPLHITDFDWETDPTGTEAGGWGLRLKTEDIARFGQLYLQEGVWDGKTILPAAWVKEATTAHIIQPGKEEDRPGNDWLQGYGYQFWRCRHNAYRGDGAYGQYCIVMPEHQMVIAITSETGDMQNILNQAWKYLLQPGQKAGSNEALQRKLAALALPLPKGNQEAISAAHLKGAGFSVAPNTLGISRLKIDLSKKDGVLSITDKKGKHNISFGLNGWKGGETTFPIEWLKLIPTAIPGNPPLYTSASASWKDDRNFEIICRFVDTAHYMLLRLTLKKEDEVVAEFTQSISLLGNDPKPYATLKGRKQL